MTVKDSGSDMFQVHTLIFAREYIVVFLERELLTM